jgi:hypothetical protein
MQTLSTAAAAIGGNSNEHIESVQRYESPNAPTSDAELHLRAEFAERQVANLKAALENMTRERDRWRTIAEHRSLPGQRVVVEGSLARSEAREWWWRLSD